MENVIQEKVTQKDNKRLFSFIISAYYVSIIIYNLKAIIQYGLDFCSPLSLVVNVLFAVAFFIGKKDKILILASGLYGVNALISLKSIITNPVGIINSIAGLLLAVIILFNCVSSLSDKISFSKKIFWLPSLLYLVANIIIVAEVFIDNFIYNSLYVIRFPIIALLIGIWVTSDKNDTEVTYDKKNIIKAVIIVVVYTLLLELSVSAMDLLSGNSKCKFQYSDGSTCGVNASHGDLCEYHFNQLNDTYNYYAN